MTGYDPLLLGLPPELDLPERPPAPPAEPARQGLAQVATVSPPTVYLAGNTSAPVPCTVLGGYLPFVGDWVVTLETPGTVFVLGTRGWGVEPPAYPMMIGHFAHTTGGQAINTTATAITMNHEAYDPLGIHSGSSAFVTLPWDGWYELGVGICYNGLATRQMGFGAGSWTGGGTVHAGWYSFDTENETINSTRFCPVPPVPHYIPAGTLIALTAFTTVAGATTGSGYGRNGELWVKWLGRRNPVS